MLSVNEIISALNGVIDPNTHKKLEVTDENSQLQLKDKQLDLGLTLGYPLNDREGAFRTRIQEALSPLGVELASLQFGLDIKKHAVQGELRPLENVKNIIAVASGKGGDRKSTRLNSSHVAISYAVFCLKKKTNLHTKLHTK